MKVTKKQIIDFVKSQLRNNDAWVLRGLTRIYEFQTADEQAVGRTHNLNGVGFSGCDAEILSSFAVQYTKRGTLSPKQMDLLRKKMVRYHKQIASLIPEDTLLALVEKSLVETK